MGPEMRDPEERNRTPLLPTLEDVIVDGNPLLEIKGQKHKGFD